MSYFLGAIILMWITCGLLYRSTLEGPRDNFGAAFPLLLLGIAIISTLVYVCMAFWLHRFL
jgi:hypothetical protein